MALYLPLCKFVDSSETIVAPSAVITDEGQALVANKATQSVGVTPSIADGTGGANEIFAGFSFAGTSATPFVPSYGVKIENFYTPTLSSASQAIFTLSYTPITATILVYNVTKTATIPNGTAGANATWALNGKVLTITAGTTAAGISAGDVIQVIYKYNWTVIQARARVGDVQPGGYVGNYVGQIGLVKRGIIYTDFIDTSVDWSAATSVNVGTTIASTGVAAVNGILTSGATTSSVKVGAAIDARIISLPTESVPFLGIEFST